jgi:hypothetical protein
MNACRAGISAILTALRHFLRMVNRCDKSRQNGSQSHLLNEISSDLEQFPPIRERGRDVW